MIVPIVCIPFCYRLAYIITLFKRSLKLCYIYLQIPIRRVNRTYIRHTLLKGQCTFLRYQSGVAQNGTIGLKIGVYFLDSGGLALGTVSARIIRDYRQHNRKRQVLFLCLEVFCPPCVFRQLIIYCVNYFSSDSRANIRASKSAVSDNRA